VENFNLGDSLMTALSTNLTIGAATAAVRGAQAANATVVTVRSAQSVADIVKYNMTACMVSKATRLPRAPGSLVMSVPLSMCLCYFALTSSFLYISQVESLEGLSMLHSYVLRGRFSGCLTPSCSVLLTSPPAP
jgi:hypothetical protein